LEIKTRQEIAARDFRSLRDVAAALGSNWLAGIAVTCGKQIGGLDTEYKIWEVPAHRLLA